MKAIETTGLTKRYEDVTALDRVDLTAAGTTLVLAALATATWFLYRGLDRKWTRTSFTE